jgi:hypothetical protein
VDDEGRQKSTDLIVRPESGERYRNHRVLEGHYQALETHFQELWFTLARSRWNSLALVPADPADSTAGVVAKIADVGRRLRHTPVTFLVMAGAIEFASAGKFVSAVARNDGNAGEEPLPSRVVIAVPSVIAEPLALAVTDAADVVVLYVRKGTTRRKSVERTIEMVGRDRILGCVLG